MRLEELLSGLACEVSGGGAEVMGIAYDSRSVLPGYLFAAVPGEHVDGHAFIKAAVAKGATAVLAERPSEGVTVPQVIVRDAKAALSRVSANFYGRPSEALTLLGVTGTNGKTTSTFLLEAILASAGFRPGVIGTINYRYGGNVKEAPHTTPQAPELQAILREMADAGSTHCVMEASSHALEQRRVADCAFKGALFTNLTHDHLDYHKTMEEYFRCKSILFEMVEANGGVSVINTDDPWGERLKSRFSKARSFSLKSGADIYPRDYRLLDGAIEALLATPEGDIPVSSHLVGEYNLQNIMGAAGLASALGIGAEAIAKGIRSLNRVPGRLEKISSTQGKAFNAYVDYAHTGDALERALAALRNVAAGRIITVFGCGGNRDRLKRPRMGEISARLSDMTIITSDNPRDEEPLEIIAEIEAGLNSADKHRAGEAFEKGYAVVPDRREAIRKAVELARDGDTVLVAGKGHEDYQIVKGVKTRFSDLDEIEKAIKDLCGSKAV